MKLSVASFLLIFSIGLPLIVPGQTTKRKTNNQSARSTPRNETLKICQGVPIPDGYIIVAYVTSSACGHGAYVLKRQEDRETPVVKSEEARESPAQRSNGATTQSVPSTAAARRPRRVGVAQTNSDNTLSNRDVTEPEASQPEPSGDTALDPAERSQPVLSGITRTTERTRPTLSGMTPALPTVSATPQTLAPPDTNEVGEGEVLRIDTTLVTVPVSVLDRQGRFVPNLKKEDFSVFENGTEQPIAYFEPTEKPFTVALLLDTSASTRFHLDEIKAAAVEFARQLRPQDRVLVVTFNDQVLLLTEATNDLKVINGVIEEYAYTGDSTRLYDAVDLVIKERLNKVKGRKAIVLFTDGVDTSSYLATYQSTLAEAEELDALIYPIQYDTTDYLRAMQGGGTVTIVTNRSNWPFPNRRSSVIYGIPPTGMPLPGATKADYERADQYLHELAFKTGARLYQANDTTQLAQAFSRIAEELRRQYSLGYYPQTAATQSGERREIKVRVRQPNLAVRARDSYVRSTSTPPVK